MSAAEDLPNPSEEIEVSPETLAALLEAGPSNQLRLIDCREEDEWHLCRIEGSQLVPLSEFAERVAAWEADDEVGIVVYCHHGMRSLRATQFLRGQGFAKTFSLAGGIDAWSTAIDPKVPRY